MKIKSMFTAFTLKALLIITCITIGFAGFTKCEAQSPAGKWNSVSSKQYYTTEAAKKLGKAFIEVQTASAASSVIDEFKADHTYIKTISGKYQPKPITLTGTWSVSGNQLEIKMDAQQKDPTTNPKTSTPTTSTFMVSGNTLTMIMPVPGNSVMASKINKIEETFEKM